MRLHYSRLYCINIHTVLLAFVSSLRCVFYMIDIYFIDRYIAYFINPKLANSKFRITVVNEIKLIVFILCRIMQFTLWIKKALF